MSVLDSLIEQLKEEINSLALSDRVQALNKVKKALKEVSPFTEPVDCVIWVPKDKVRANTYNPNHVATPEMKLLHTSIKTDGFTQPIVAYRNAEEDVHEVVDGFHRSRIGKEYPDISERTHGYLPLTEIDKPLQERMGSTIRHNRARGTHKIRPMSDIVLELTMQGWNEYKICTMLGMELEEVIRLKQITGLKEAFMNHEFSKSWEEFKSKREEG